MKTTNLIFLVIAILLTTACASVYRQEGLESLPRSEYAVIDLKSCEKPCPVIQEVDGKWRGAGKFEEYQVKHGLRTVKFIYATLFVHGESGIIVEFDAKKGAVYGVRGNVDHSSMSWKPEIYEVSTGKVVSKTIGTAYAY